MRNKHTQKNKRPFFFCYNTARGEHPLFFLSFFRWLVHLFLFPRVTSGRWKTGGIRTSEREREALIIHTALHFVCVYFHSTSFHPNPLWILEYFPLDNKQEKKQGSPVTQSTTPSLLFFYLATAQNVLHWSSCLVAGAVLPVVSAAAAAAAAAAAVEPWEKLVQKYWQRVIN